MESTRHTAEYWLRFDAYFDLLSGQPYQNDVDIMQLEKFCFNADIRTENIYDMGENGFLMGRADAQRLILRKDVAERLKKSGEPEARMNGN